MRRALWLALAAAREVHGTAGTGPVESGNGAGGVTDAARASDVTPAGTEGLRADARPESDTSADASATGPLDATPNGMPAVQYSSANWKPAASVTAAGTAEVPSNAFDGKIDTRWTTGRDQMGDESFEVDFGKTITVSRVVLDDTTFPQDFPVAYTLEVSTDGMTFMAVSMGMGATVTNIHFATVNARYIRIRQTATGTKWWSIGELSVYP